MTTQRASMPGARTPWWAWAVGWVGLAAHLALFFWYVASGLLAPAWAVVTLLVVWAALLAVAVRLLLRRRPLLVPVVPIVGLLLWFAAISAGEAWLGWRG